MAHINKMFQEIKQNLETVVAQDSHLGQLLWNELIELHPADIADFIADLDREDGALLFKALPDQVRADVFVECSELLQMVVLEALSDGQKVQLFTACSADQLTDLFEHLSEEEVKRYLNLLHQKERKKVVSLLKFDSDSAGGIMDPSVVTFIEDATVEKSIRQLQRLSPKRELHQIIYVTNRESQLVGCIHLSDLVLKNPDTKIADILRKNEVVAHATEDKEAVAKLMVHYKLMTVPVVGEHNYFLGAIPDSTLVDVIEEEASEDVYKMSAMSPMRFPYFETPFFRLLYERSYILIALLIAESFASTILHAYESSLTQMLLSFITVIVSVGGNSSSQTSALAIQGITSGDINRRNIVRFLRREFVMSLFIAGLLGVSGFARVYYASRDSATSVVVALSIAIVVSVAIVLGSCIPILLKRINIDPAFSAGPFLATLMDILGTLIFCYLCKVVLFSGM